jgi:hypothetical protein
LWFNAVLPLYARVCAFFAPIQAINDEKSRMRRFVTGNYFHDDVQFKKFLDLTVTLARDRPKIYAGREKLLREAVGLFGLGIYFYYWLHKRGMKKNAYFDWLERLYLHQYRDMRKKPSFFTVTGYLTYRFLQTILPPIL